MAETTGRPRAGDSSADVDIYTTWRDRQAGLSSQSVIRAHRRVLCSGSGFFRSACSGAAATAGTMRVSLEGLLHDDVAAAVEFMYTGSVAESQEWTVGRWESMRDAAVKLDMPLLRQECQRHVGRTAVS
ncbi:hypothetical protein GGI15_001303 [Coemansia interrupta]|uniref:BTB domain-containing protein n=1 Tax=Coemansia interrupta TaxID=1126814 RepID=A0A9W8LNR6_9FUNG|nr:hypothetical protein GGI15_001303 [Coemansia interrupta]